MNTVYLFVYGTLMSGFDNEMAHYLHQNALLLGKGTTRGTLIDLGEYPALILKDDSNPVHGELYALKEPFQEVLHRLDVHEGIGEGQHYATQDEYVRQLITVFTENKEWSAHSYIYNGVSGRHPRILSGDYVTYLDLKKSESPNHQSSRTIL